MFRSALISSGTNQGFALLTVLFGIAVITLLLSVSIDRSASHSKLLAFEARQLEERAQFLGVVEAAGQLAAQGDIRISASEPISMSIGAVTYQVWLRDITGLIDINTGQLPLLERLFASYDLPAADLVSQLDVLRKRNQRFLNIAELSKLDGINATGAAALQPFLTVFSGRRGIAPEHAPAELLDRLTGRTGARTGLEGLIPKDWLTVPQGGVYAISIEPEQTQSPAHQAIIQVTGGRRSRVRIVRLAL